ncbi:UNC93-like 2, partial [Homarus americanus]
MSPFYGVIFPGESEAAFSNYRLWESLGYIFSYVGSATYCMDVKITNVVVSLVFGIIGYYAIEVLERRGGLKKDDKNN